MSLGGGRRSTECHPITLLSFAVFLKKWKFAELLVDTKEELCQVIKLPS